MSKTQITQQARRYETIDAAAQRLACNPRTIRRLIATGELTGYRLGKRMLRIDASELDALATPIVSGGAA